jgi:hypothetical protein
MLLSEFKEYLAYGELSQLHVGELIDDNTELPRLVSAINLGLTELYKRFPLKLAEVIIQLSNNRTNYVISSRHAESKMLPGDDPKNFYVKDSEYYPFMDDIAQIEQVFNEDGEEIPLNDENLRYSVFTVGHNVINHPYPENENVITVIYRAHGTKLKISDILVTEDDEVTYVDAEIDIPQQFVEPLVNYVAYRTFAAINMNSAEAVNYYAKFEAACALINTLGLWHKTNNTNMRLENTGWV